MAVAPDYGSYIGDPRFSRTFALPPDPASGRHSAFHIKYADYGYRNEAHPEQESVVLFYGSMVGSRLVHIAKDEIAKKHKVRILNPDKPGFGGTDAVDPKRLMDLWLHVVTMLLKHLGIQHVSLACHSGGTVYALDMLLHHPEILHPDRPYLAIGAPWVLPSHTNSKAMAIAYSLPSSVMSQSDKAAKLINNYVGPTVGIVFGISQVLVSKVTPTSGSQPSETADEARDAVKFEERLQPEIIDRMYAEGVHGISSDSVLLMQKVQGTKGWGSWGDYDKLVPRLVESLRSSVRRRCVIEVFYAEKDSMIGDGDSKGPLWFDQCWNTNYSDVIEYRRTVVKGADHNGIWNLRWGAVQKMVETVGQSSSESPLDATGRA